MILSSVYEYGFVRFCFLFSWENALIENLLAGLAEVELEPSDREIS